jgi:hypothetical protein
MGLPLLNAGFALAEEMFGSIQSLVSIELPSGPVDALGKSTTTFWLRTELLAGMNVVLSRFGRSLTASFPFS